MSRDDLSQHPQHPAFPDDFLTDPCRYVPPPDDLGVTIVRAGGDQTRSFLGLPLVLHDRVIGVMSVQSYAPGMYSSDQIQFMEMLATQTAIAVEHSRLYDQAQREIEQRAAAEASLRQANERLQAQLEEIERLREQLQEQAIRDPLTGQERREYGRASTKREAERLEARLKAKVAEGRHRKNQRMGR